MVRIDQLELAGKRVFIRVDFDVALDPSLQVLDDALIRLALPTLEHALGEGAKVILASHRGHPRPESQQESLEPAAARLAELLDKEVKLADDCVGDGVKKLVQDMRNGELLVLENLRFHRGEEANDPEFARQLASLCEVYVNEAFGASHRAHASVAGMVPLVVGPRAAGLWLTRELEQVERLATRGEQPLAIVLGGGEVRERLPAIDALLPRSQVVLLGGALAHTCLVAQGTSLGRTPVDRTRLDAARTTLENARRLGVRLLLPTDHVCSDGARLRLVAERVPDELTAVDIGPRTQAEFRVEILKARSVLWCGAMGQSDGVHFGEGTRAVARAVAEVKGTTVAAGGEAAGAIRSLDLGSQVSHLSSADEACLELVAGRSLPGIAALNQGQ